ncbi:MAG: MSMEG_0567/Sll0786 family nitrogen starvation N-acetyltransferase [Polyangiaceae bacterium]|jgi:putative N-acetyltransferase (TIGR04045 family)
MLETDNVWGRDVPPFISPTITAQIVNDTWQCEAYYRLRRSIFAEEQQLFSESDRDEHDLHATAIVALSHLAGMVDEVVGVVRIYSTEPGTWFGGRLGVTTRYRSRRVVGTALICAAVSTAHAWGCTRFLATIQAPNVRYFEHHHFAVIEPVEVCGQPHYLMQADVRAYPRRAAYESQPVQGDVASLIPRRPRAA